MAASYDDIEKIVTVARKYLLPSDLSTMVAEMFEEIKDSNNRSLVTTFRRLNAALNDPDDVSKPNKPRKTHPWRNGKTFKAMPNPHNSPKGQK